MVEWVDGTVVKNIRCSDGLHILQVEASVLPFRAGQYTKLALDVNGERIERPYSFVNPPSEDLLEFYFNTVPDGAFTGRLSMLKSGESIMVAKTPSGFFTLDEVPDAEHLWLLATGTAVGPFISMLKTNEPWGRFSRIILVHGVRYIRDLNYQHAIAEFERRDPNKFAMIPFVTREKTSFAMDAHIPDAIKSGELERRVGLRIGPEQSHVMVCGNPDMIKDTKEVLHDRGMEKNLRRKPGHVTTEHYWQND